MDTKIRNYLGVALIFGVVVAALAVINVSYSYSRSTDPLTAPNVRATGEGKVVAVPDIAQFSFSVITEGSNTDELQSENAKKINQIIEYLKSEGIAKEDIETQNYDLQPRYEYFSCPPRGGVCPPPRINGYTINQSVTVKLRNLDKAGTVLGGVTEKGASSISGLSFTIDDRTKFENEARAKAINQAKEKAKATAEAAGVKLGRLLSISEYAPYPPTGFEGLRAGGLDKAATATPQVEPGSEEIVITLDLIYEIK